LKFHESKAEILEQMITRKWPQVYNIAPIFQIFCVRQARLGPQLTIAS